MMATMAPAFSYPEKPRRGDAVAVLSPSAGLPARFPLPYELGLTRLREEFGLRPVEYPTTRAAQASPAERGADIHAAFADPDIKAVVASIGGEDELKVLAHLDPDVLRATQGAREHSAQEGKNSGSAANLHEQRVSQEPGTH